MSLPELFDTWVRCAGEREALRWHGGAITYRDLNAQADRLAVALRNAGAGRGALVGVALERDAWLVVALLAVMKAGAAYVPLDPAYPVERLAYMLSDAGCRLLIADAATHKRLAAQGASCARIAPNAHADLPLQPHPAVKGGASDLAYVIYTSGSTGKPKGVAIEHRSACALIEWAQRTFDAEELSGMLACTSVCFDLSMFELFVPLCSGGRVVLLENAMALADSPLRHEVRFVNTVPSAMHELLRIDGLPEGVRGVCLAGEPFPAELARALGRHPGLRRIVNAYGPTEDTTYSTWAELDPASPDPPAIGRPLPGTHAWILDEQLRPCAERESGELFLGGIGLARGYLGRPELTAERFLRDPFSDDPNSRLYRTGDRVRLRADGQLEYIGRLDTQVKIRGYRIELGEIERCLGDQTGVAECVAAVADGPDGDLRLVAYYTGDAAPGPLRVALAHSLPAFMVPALFVPLREMPHTLSGKCDRKRLPPPDWSTRAAEGAPARTDPTSPTDTTEDALARTVAAIWREVLGFDAIAPDSDFLALGGHSLTATRIVARLREAFGTAPGVRELFAAGTLAGCIDAMRARSGDAAHPPPDALRASALEAPLTAAQLPMWFLKRLDPAETAYNQPCVVRIAGTVAPERVHAALRSVVAAQPALRIGIHTLDGEPRQRVHAAAEPTFATIAHAGDAATLEAAARQEALRLAAQTISLDSPPLLRGILLRGGEASALALAVHHAVFDEWSLAVLVQGLAAACAGEVLPTHIGPEFVDVCAERAHRDWGAMATQAQREFAEVPAALRLPMHPAPSVRTGGSGIGGCFVSRIDVDRTQRLRAIAARFGATDYMLLLAALQMVLRRVTDQRRFATLTAFSGRETRADESRIGCYINMVPVRADVDDDEPFDALLARVRERSLAALERQCLPIERVVSPAHRSSGDARPFEQVAFGIQTAPLAEAEAGGLRWSGHEVRNAAARLPLSLWIDPRSRTLRAEWTYRADQFRAAEIERMHAAYADLLDRICATPQAAVGTLLRDDASIAIHRLPTAIPAADSTARNATRLPKNAPAPKKSLPTSLAPRSLGREDAVAVLRGWLGGALPTLFTPRVPGLGAAEWAAERRALIETELDRTAGVLLRGFRVDGTADFCAFAKAVSNELIHYSERSSPRTEVIDGVYTSTDHPPDQPIVLHNEQSYTLNWPLRIGFHCVRPALERGRTPIADSRRILARLSAATVERFERLGVMYVRNYHAGISLPWTVAFQTDDRATVEAYCSDAGVRTEWVGGERLRTRQVRPAVRVHPRTGERTWFNHALFFHVTSLPEEISRSLRAAMPESDLPYNTYYGDGSPIDDETLAELRAAFDAETVSFDWKAGDVLLLDNMLAAHGREPFVGPRVVQAVMADPYRSICSAADVAVSQV